VAGYAISRTRKTETVVADEERFRRFLQEAEAAIRKDRHVAASDTLEKAREIPGYERNQEVLHLSHRLAHRGVRSGLRGAWCLATLEWPIRPIHSVALTPDSGFLVAGGGAHLFPPVTDLEVWDLKEGKKVRELVGHTEAVGSLSMTPDGSRVLSASEASWCEGKNTLKLWDLASGRCLRNLVGHEGEVSSVAISHDGRFALSGGYDNSVKLWDLETGRCLRTMSGHSGVVLSVAMGTAGKLGVSDSADKTLKLWDLSTGECLRTLEGQGGECHAVCFTPDMRYIVSAVNGKQGDDTHLNLWNTATGERLAVLDGHSDEIASIAVTPDGKFALTGSLDKTARFWHLETGECVQTLSEHDENVLAVNFSDDGRYAVTACIGKIRYWELDWEFDFPEPADWDDGAAPFLESFLLRQSLDLKSNEWPNWNGQDVDRLLEDLRKHGFGWLRATGIRKRLEQMAGKRTDNQWLHPADQGAETDEQYEDSEAVAMVARGALHAQREEREEAGKWFRLGAERNLVDAAAAFQLGCAFCGGLGVEQDYTEGAKWLQKAAEAGDAEAQFFLADLYESGNGVDKDVDVATDWYRKAADQGHEESRNILEQLKAGTRFADIESLRKAAEEGKAAAQGMLGMIYYHGQDVEQDFALAAQWLRRAAEQGNMAAQANYGGCLLLGQGVPCNKSEAYQWFRKAAEQGLPLGQHNVGCCFADGIGGVEKDLSEAFKWFQQAAEQGYAPAQHNVGHYLQHGWGVMKDLTEAAKWYRLAASQGYAAAQAALKKLVG